MFVWLHFVIIAD